MRTFIPVLCLVAAAGCGYVGAPMPPALNIPERVQVVNASQQADQLVVGFLITGKTTDGLVLNRLRAIELRAGPPAASMHLWAQKARQIPVGSPAIDGHELKTPMAGWENQDIVVAVRAVGPTGRPGAWSEPLTVHVVPAPAIPVVSASPGPEGITLSWPPAGAPAGTKWRVFRKKTGDERAVALAESSEPRWTDAAMEENGQFTYQVQALVPAGSRLAESERSREVSVAYKDVFPPAAPASLSAIAGIGSIELTWEPNREPDLRGYQMYRAEASGALTKIGELTGEVTYSDKAVEHAKRYVYAVSAVDKLGNESKPSATVEIAAP
jgi:hypothetical protein